MRIPVFAFVLLAGTLRVQSSDLDGISLAGKWRFEIDSRDAGLRERWFARALKERIELPGALQNQGFGNDVGTNTEWTGAANVQTWLNGPQYAAYRKPGNIKVPFCLQPEKHYAGAAWYQRDIQVPAGWSDKRVVLFLERPHWETRVWLDGNEVDMCKSLSTPHIHELGFGIPPGKHALTIRVDNRRVVDVGSWAHSVTDNTQGNWNGIVGRIELAATSPVWIEDAQLYPNLARNSVVVKVKLGNATERPGSGTFIMAGKKFPVKWEAIGGAASFEVMFNRIKPWDEFHPELSKLVLQLKGSLDSRNSAQKSAPLEISDRQTFVSGFREISVQGKQILLNGRPIFLRGTLECCVFPLTGYPPTDVGPWKKIIQTCQAHGLNHIRFHSWCPPDAAFTAADELGFYLSIEAGVWANVGDDQPIDGWLQDETERILKAYGNHPSFLLMASGNEPGGKNVARYLGQWVNRCKQADPRRLFTSASGWPAIPENQYHVSQAPRGPKGWLGKDYRFEIESGRDKRDTVGTIDVPVVVHEMGQWCAYPDFAEISKFGGPLKPHNFEIFRDSLSENGMLDQDKDFARASGKLQALCYKEEIEAALRTPGIAGYQLLGLSDFPGQGTAPVGVLDCFWEPKGYITPEEFARFCGPTVPLARLFKRVWKSDETLSADIEVANYGPEPITKAVAECKLVADDGTTVVRGELPSRALPTGRTSPLGRAVLDLSKIACPREYRFVVNLKGTPFQNDWPVWVYPASLPAEPVDVFTVTNLDSRVVNLLKVGHRVLWLASNLPERHPALTFEPIFWNRYLFSKQNRQTLGLLCDRSHPALAQFPTDMNSDWEWEQIVSAARAVVLNDLPKKLHPVVQVIDDWNTNRRLGLVFECRVDKGKLLVCSADLLNNLEARPAARQLRQSLLAYMASGDCSPSVKVTSQELLLLLDAPREGTRPTGL